MKLGSLFSGYGGLDLGLQAALGDVSTAWVSDIEPGPVKILAKRFPDAPNLGDVTTVDWAEVEPVDIICGGSPCQDLSSAGRRRGMMPGTRSGLWESMTRAIDALKPQLVVWENVKGAYSASAYSQMESEAGRVGTGSDGPVLRALGRVLGDLTNLGYDAAWTAFRASSVGAPHRRERVFVVAHPRGDGLGRAWPKLRGPEHAPATGDRPLLPTPQARDGKGIPGDGGLDLRTTVTLLPTPVSSFRDRSRAEVDERFGKSNSRGVQGPNLDDIVHFDSAKFGDYTPAITRWEHILGREAPSPTTLNNNGNPRLSAAFVEWMMGLPKGWVTDVPISRALQLRALGNGVVPQQGAAAITQLLEVSHAHAA